MSDKAVTIRPYIIKKGDTLSELARKYNTTVEALMLLNTESIVDADLIYYDRTLFVPEPAKIANSGTIELPVPPEVDKNQPICSTNGDYVDLVYFPGLPGAKKTRPAWYLLSKQASKAFREEEDRLDDIIRPYIDNPTQDTLDATFGKLNELGLLEMFKDLKLSFLIDDKAERDDYTNKVLMLASAKANLLKRVFKLPPELVAKGQQGQADWEARRKQLEQSAGTPGAPAITDLYNARYSEINPRTGEVYNRALPETLLNQWIAATEQDIAAIEKKYIRLATDTYGLIVTKDQQVITRDEDKRLKSLAKVDEVRKSTLIWLDYVKGSVQGPLMEKLNKAWQQSHEICKEQPFEQFTNTFWQQSGLQPTVFGEEERVAQAYFRLITEVRQLNLLGIALPEQVLNASELFSRPASLTETWHVAMGEKPFSIANTIKVLNDAQFPALINKLQPELQGQDDLYRYHHFDLQQVINALDKGQWQPIWIIGYYPCVRLLQKVEEAITDSNSKFQEALGLDQAPATYYRPYLLLKYVLTCRIDEIKQRANQLMTQPLDRRWFRTAGEQDALSNYNGTLTLIWTSDEWETHYVNQFDQGVPSFRPKTQVNLVEAYRLNRGDTAPHYVRDCWLTDYQGKTECAHLHEIDAYNGYGSKAAEHATWQGGKWRVDLANTLKEARKVIGPQSSFTLTYNKKFDDVVCGKVASGTLSASGDRLNTPFYVATAEAQWLRFTKGSSFKNDIDYKDAYAYVKKKPVGVTGLSAELGYDAFKGELKFAFMWPESFDRQKIRLVYEYTDWDAQGNPSEKTADYDMGWMQVNGTLSASGYIGVSCTMASTFHVSRNHTGQMGFRGERTITTDTLDRDWRARQSDNMVIRATMDTSNPLKRTEEQEKNQRKAKSKDTHLQGSMNLFAGLQVGGELNVSLRWCPPPKMGASQPAPDQQIAPIQGDAPIQGGQWLTLASAKASVSLELGAGISGEFVITFRNGKFYIFMAARFVLGEGASGKFSFEVDYYNILKFVELFQGIVARPGYRRVIAIQNGERTDEETAHEQASSGSLLTETFSHMVNLLYITLSYGLSLVEAVMLSLAKIDELCQRSLRADQAPRIARYIVDRAPEAWFDNLLPEVKGRLLYVLMTYQEAQFHSDNALVDFFDYATGNLFNSQESQAKANLDNIYQRAAIVKVLGWISNESKEAGERQFFESITRLNKDGSKDPNLFLNRQAFGENWYQLQAFFEKLSELDDNDVPGLMTELNRGLTKDDPNYEVYIPIDNPGSGSDNNGRLIDIRNKLSASFISDYTLYEYSVEDYKGESLKTVQKWIYTSDAIINIPIKERLRLAKMPGDAHRAS